MTDCSNDLPMLVRELGALADDTGAGDEVASLWPDVTANLAECAAGPNERWQLLVGSIRVRHDALTRGIGRSLVLENAIRAEVTVVEMADILYRFQRLNAAVDATKLAKEDIERCQRDTDRLLNAPCRWGASIAAVNVSVHGLVHLHAAALAAFLGRPSQARNATTKIVTMFRAFATEAASKWVPFLGIVEALADVATPTIQKELENMRAAGQAGSRLFDFDDALARIAGRVRDFEKMAVLAQTEVDEIKLDMQVAAEWLFPTLARAARA